MGLRVYTVTEGHGSLPVYNDDMFCMQQDPEDSRWGPWRVMNHEHWKDLSRLYKLTMSRALRSYTKLQCLLYDYRCMLLKTKANWNQVLAGCMQR